jgi:hypothetical protein
MTSSASKQNELIHVSEVVPVALFSELCQSLVSPVMTCQLTLRPPHLILNPGGALAHGTSKLHGSAYSLIFSVMFTMLAVITQSLCD